MINTSGIIYFFNKDDGLSTAKGVGSVKKNIFAYKVIFLVLFAAFCQTMNRSLQAIEGKALDPVKNEYELKQDEIKKEQDKLKEAQDRKAAEEQVRLQDKKSYDYNEQKYQELQENMNYLAGEELKKAQTQAEIFKKAVDYAQTEIKQRDQTITKTQAEIDAINQELTKLTQQLGSLAEEWAPVEEYKSVLQADVINVNKADPVQAQNNLFAEFLEVKAKGYGKYNEQLRFLGELKEAAAAIGATNELAMIDDRIAQIEEQPTHKQVAKNALEQELKLDKMIPQDQVDALNDKLLALSIELEKAISDKNIASLTNVLSEFFQAKAAIEHFGLMTSKYKSVKESADLLGKFLKQASDAIETVRSDLEKKSKTKELTADEKFLQNILQKPEELTPTDMFESFNIFTSLPVALFNYAVEQALEKESVRNVIKSVGKKYYTQDMIDAIMVMNALPGTITYLEQMVDIMSPIVGTSQRIIELVPGKIANDILASIQDADRVLKKLVSKRQKYRDLALAAKNMAPYVQWLADTLKEMQNIKAPSEVNKALNEIKEAQAMIEKERKVVELSESRKSQFSDIYDAVKGFFVSIAKQIKALFIKELPELQKARKDYNQAKREYLIALGYQIDPASNIESDPRPSQEEIQNKLLGLKAEFVQNPALEEKVNKANGKLLDALNKLVQKNKQILDQVQGAVGNLQFAVYGWDSLLTDNLDQNKKYADWVQKTFELRDERLAYIDAARHGLNELESELKTITDQDATTISDQVVKTIASTINGEYLDNIAVFTQHAQNMIQLLNEQRDQFQGVLISKGLK